MKYVLLIDFFLKHGIDSDKQLPYVHVDIAGSSGLYPDMPKATPLLGLSAMYLKGRFWSVKNWLRNKRGERQISLIVLPKKIVLELMSDKMIECYMYAL